MQRIILAILIVAVLIGVVAAIALLSNRGGEELPAATQSARLSRDIGKPRPLADYFEGCPPSGAGGDPVLNTLKNRIDEGAWQPTTVAALLALDWPVDVEYRQRSRWSKGDAETVARHEGTPVQVEGYLTSAKKMSPESANCHSKQNVDYHVWIVDEAQKGREQSVVIEVTPPVKASHTEWNLSRIQGIASRKERVRISGWLMLDPEHPDQIGKTRGTIWEIHPVMQIETQRGGRWVPLDDGGTGLEAGDSMATAAPAVTPEETATQPPNNDLRVQHNEGVQITDIFYDGIKGSNEPDEYVEITNTGRGTVDITDWELQDVTGRREYKWENYTLQPGAKIRVYTGEKRPESGGFTFDSGRALWANKGDVAELYDADKELISRYAYGDKK